MKCYLDANVIVYYKVIDTPFHLESKKLIKSLYSEQITPYTSPLALDEYMYSVRKLLLKTKSQQVHATILRSLQSILSLRNLRLINPPTDPTSQLLVVKYMKEYALKPRDAYHLLTMKHNDISHFATFDHDFVQVFKEGNIKHFT